MEQYRVDKIKWGTWPSTQTQTIRFLYFHVILFVFFFWVNFRVILHHTHFFLVIRPIRTSFRSRSLFTPNIYTHYPLHFSIHNFHQFIIISLFVFPLFHTLSLFRCLILLSTLYQSKEREEIKEKEKWVVVIKLYYKVN